MADDLAVQASIQTQLGWVDLEDIANGYELGKESFTEQGVSWRKQTVSSDWLEGTFVNHGVRENVVEKLSVYVTGATPYEMAVRMKVITDALGQTRFGLKFTFDDLQETWSCTMSDYTISSTQELRFSKLALVQASISRLPSVALAQVSP